MSQNILIEFIPYGSNELGNELVTCIIKVEKLNDIAITGQDSCYLKEGKLVIKFMKFIGLIEFVSIKLLNSANGNLIASLVPRKPSKIDYLGDIVHISSNDNSKYFIHEDISEFRIDIPKKLPDLPLTICLVVRLTKRINEFIRKIKGSDQNKDVNTRHIIAKKFSNHLAYLTNTTSTNKGFKEKINRFNQLSEETVSESINSQTFWGENLELIKYEVVSSRIFSYGFFEPELTAFFIDFLSKDKICIDIGAHLGYFSMLAAELVGQNGTIISFEPTPKTINILKKNTSIYPQVTIVPKLAWHKTDVVKFNDFGGQFSAYNTAVVDRLSDDELKIANKNELLIESISIDEYCFTNEVVPDLIKIDAESSEINVLKGMKRILTNVRPFLTIEVGDKERAVKEGVPKTKSILEYLIDYSYIPIESICGRYRIHNLQDNYSYDNLILIPNEKLPFRENIDTISINRGQVY